MSKRIGVDVDGVLARFNTAFHRRLLNVLGVDKFPVGYDAANPTEWEWPRQHGYSKEEEDKVWKAVWADPYFWKTLDPMPYAQEDVLRLDGLSRNGHDVYFITNRKGVKVKRQTEDWLEARGMYFPTVLITGSNKHPVIHGLELDCFIDDRLSFMNELAVDHTDCVGVTRPYLYHTTQNDKPNRNKFLRVVTSVGAMLNAEGL